MSSVNLVPPDARTGLTRRGAELPILTEIEKIKKGVPIRTRIEFLHARLVMKLTYIVNETKITYLKIGRNTAITHDFAINYFASSRCRYVETCAKFTHSESMDFATDCFRLLLYLDVPEGSKTAERIQPKARSFYSVRPLPLNRRRPRVPEAQRRQFRLSNEVDWPDCQIAATALRLDAEVFTQNVKHFTAFPGLRVVKAY
jgi:hypothetical protein